MSHWKSVIEEKKKKRRYIVVGLNMFFYGLNFLKSKYKISKYRIVFRFRNLKSDF